MSRDVRRENGRQTAHISRMPVVGHAFYGVATALTVRADRSCRRRALQTMWVGVAVVLAYVPDLANYTLQFAGVQNARVMSHSMLFAVLCATVVGAGLAAVSGASFLAMGGFALFSVASHDGLDLLQATDRMPLWPFSTREFGLGFSVISSNLIVESVLFGAGFVVFLVLWHWRRPGEIRVMWNVTRSAWATYVLIVVILGFAVTTDHLRDRRDEQLLRAAVLNESGDYRAALYYAQQAERWPVTVRKAHLLTIKGEAYENLGDRKQAEQSYLRAYEQDNTYFYAVANLAMLYARSDLPVESRRKLVGPWIVVLQRSEFASEPALPVTLRRLEVRLGYGSGALRPSSTANQ